MNESDDKQVASSTCVPDFSMEALAHLQVQCDSLGLRVQGYLNAPDVQNREQLTDDFKRFRNTLVLLEKVAAVYVAEELITLLVADANGELADQSELARVLVLAADQLSEHVARLQHDSSLDSALPLLALVNDSRACRGESLLSDALVLAAGIELPKAADVSEGDLRWQLEREQWVAQVRSSHGALAQSLLQWWKSSDGQKSDELVTELENLSDFCDGKDFLQILTPLYRCASLVAQAIKTEELKDGPALRSLYAQLERNIHSCELVQNPADLLPGDLLRNFLYYLAQVESTQQSVLDLHRRFRLDRVRQASRINDDQHTPTIGVGYHLARAIRSSIAEETESLRLWLEEAHAAEKQPPLVKLRVRLDQLEPVLTLMGAPEALSALQSINIELRRIEQNKESTAEERTQLAQSLLRLDVLLDQNARRSVRRRSGATPASTISAEEVFADMATDACLRQARENLQEIAKALESLLLAGPLPTGRCHAVCDQIKTIDQALQIVPLPKLSPLLEGLRELLTRLQQAGRGLHQTSGKVSASLQIVREEIATLLVSLDYYLGCVLHATASSNKLLLDAEGALLRARKQLDEVAANAPAKKRRDTDKPIAVFLPHMDALGLALMHYRSAEGKAGLVPVQNALQAFEEAATNSSAMPMQALAETSRTWMGKIADQRQHLTRAELTQLDEIHALIPQLIDQMLSGSESISGFDDLLIRLALDEVSLPEDADRDGAESEYLASFNEVGAADTDSSEHTDLVDTGFEPELFDADLEMEGAGGLTLNIDDALLADPMLDDDSSMLDSTLQHVFYHECLVHLEELDESVRSALQPNPNEALALPTEQMLRALHALSGSAQTIDAPEIVGIVQPLQRAALARQRLGKTFDTIETVYIGELVTAIRAHLDSLITGEPVGRSVMAIEKRLSGFVSASLPGGSSVENGPGVSPETHSLDDVFVEEADELLDRLRRVADKSVPDAKALSEALTVLHTLKGSARMAGRASIADYAHELESRLQGLPDKALTGQALQDGYKQLSNLMRQTQAHLAVSVPDDVEEKTPATGLNSTSLLVNDHAFDGLLDLATDVTVNQARLSDELTRLREVYQDLESATLRWRELSQQEHFEIVPALAEIQADLEAARGVMRGALRQAEREQQQASRTSAGLQQSLIRTRLVRVDEIQDRLERVVKDAADTADCNVQLKFKGGEVTLDRALYRQLVAPLEHLARNAVIHGIERAAERTGLGKPVSGTLLLSASIDGTDLVMSFKDDGRGIDKEAVSRLLVEQGESALETLEELQSTLFKSGFSSVRSPTALAGHGLGLSAVQSAVEQMGGLVQLSTTVGAGAQITFRIPQRIVVNQVVLVSNENVLFAIPVNFVESVRMANANGGTPERYIPVSLAHLLSQSVSRPHRGRDTKRAALLVTVSGESVAIEVDQVIGYRELLTQALGPQLASLKCFSGGSVLSDGQQVLILNIQQLLDNQVPARAHAVKPAKESLRPIALIVDDSLTMRVAADSVLQQCGIATRLCRDGMEALASMAVALPNLILLDLEMPRLDGVSVLKQARELYGQACPPVIVVSSRDNVQNRALLKSLGAVRFLAKPYSDSQLQEAIEAAGLRLPDLTIA